MLTTNTTVLREGIDQLERGRRAMMAAPAGKFLWTFVGRPWCGSSGCCWGWMGVGNPHMSNRILKMVQSLPEFSPWAERIGILGSWSQCVFWMDDGEWEKSKKNAQLIAWGLFPALITNRDRFNRSRANRMMKLLITRLRHRLAVCEVEQGEWGRQLPAAKMPVGAAREQAVEQLELVTA